MELPPVPWWRQQQPAHASLFSDEWSSEAFAVTPPYMPLAKDYSTRRPQQDIWHADVAHEHGEERKSHSCSRRDIKPIPSGTYVDSLQPLQAHVVSDGMTACRLETYWNKGEVFKDQDSWKADQSNSFAADSSSHNRMKIRNREKKRCQAMRCAFENLNHHIPFVPLDKGVPKITTLRLAIKYIVHLNRTLSQDKEAGTMRKFSDVVLEEVHRKNRYASSL